MSICILLLFTFKFIVLDKVYIIKCNIIRNKIIHGDKARKIELNNHNNIIIHLKQNL